MLQATDLRLTFNRGTPIENPALRGLSLSIADGEFVTVIGTNGAGKSTFLNAISGAVRVDSGSIKINGQDVTRLKTHQRAKQVARVWQALARRSRLRRIWHWLTSVATCVA